MNRRLLGCELSSAAPGFVDERAAGGASAAFGPRSRVHRFPAHDTAELSAEAVFAALSMLAQSGAQRQPSFTRRAYEEYAAAEHEATEALESRLPDIG